MFLHLQRLAFYTLHKWLLMCVYSQIKMSINESFAKAKKRLEQPKHNSQIAEQKSTWKDEEPRTNSLVPPQQPSGLGAWNYEAIVQNISTSVTQKRGSYQQHSKTNKLLAYSYYWFLNTDCFLWKFAKKKKLESPDLFQVYTCKNFKEITSRRTKCLKVEKRSPSKAIKLTRRCRPRRIGGLAKIIQIFLRFTVYIF